jgi:hypothetical protein
MVILRALLYAVAVFVGLGILSLMVALIMKILYAVVHKSEKTAKPVHTPEV